MPANLDFSATSGKPITCSGWIGRGNCATWSKKNVELSHSVIIPAPGPRQVRVKLYAAGVNPADAHRTCILVSDDDDSNASGSSAGELPPAKPRHPPPAFEFPYTCGLDGAGVVESVGWSSDEAAPSTLRVGDRVMFFSDFTRGSGGTFCEYALVDCDVVCKIPSTAECPPGSQLIDFPEAAALPAAAGTAYVALFDKLRIEKRRSIFISGGSGGVGSIAVQLAHYYGLYVFASCSSRNVRYTEELGADCVLDYTKDDVVKEVLKQTGGYGVDYVLEAASASLAEKHSECLRFGGAICVLTGLLMPATDLAFRRQLSVHYVFIGMLHQDPLARTQVKPLLEWVLQLYLLGAFDVFVEEVPLKRASEALDVVSKCHTRGKIVLTSFHPAEETDERLRRGRVKFYKSAQKELSAAEAETAEGSEPEPEAAQ